MTTDLNTDPKRSMRLLCDQCRDCCFCSPSATVPLPVVRLCRHPNLPRPLPLTDDQLKADESPVWCPARGLVVMAVGLPIVAAQDGRPDPVDEPERVRAGTSSQTPPSGRAGAVHHIVKSTLVDYAVAACSGSMLLDGLREASGVDPALRCQRKPCRDHWPD